MAVVELRDDEAVDARRRCTNATTFVTVAAVTVATFVEVVVL